MTRSGLRSAGKRAMGTVEVFDSEQGSGKKGEGAFSQDRSIAAGSKRRACRSRQMFPSQRRADNAAATFRSRAAESSFDHLPRQEIVNPIANIVGRNQRAPLIRRGLDERSTFGICP